MNVSEFLPALLSPATPKYRVLIISWASYIQEAVASVYYSYWCLSLSLTSHLHKNETSCTVPSNNSSYGPWRIEAIYKTCSVKGWLFPVLLLWWKAEFDLFLPGTTEWHLTVNCHNCVTVTVVAPNGPLYSVPNFREIIDSTNQQ